MGFKGSDVISSGLMWLWCDHGYFANPLFVITCDCSQNWIGCPKWVYKCVELSNQLGTLGKGNDILIHIYGIVFSFYLLNIMFARNVTSPEDSFLLLCDIMWVIVAN